MVCTSSGTSQAIVRNLATSGSTTVTPFSTDEYGLYAQTKAAMRQIASVRVQVSDAECLSPPINEGQVTGSIHDAIIQRLPKSSDFSVSPTGVKVTSSKNIISISISAKAQGRDVSITIEILIGLQGPPPHAVISATVTNVVAHIDTSRWENIKSLGGARACADAIENVIEIFVRGMAEDILAPEIADKLNSGVQEFASYAQQNDSKHHCP